jgi:hypothetical protein
MRDARRGRDRTFRVGAALEAVRGLGVHAEGLGRAPDRERLPVGGLEGDRARGIRDLARGPAHDPGQRQRGVRARHHADPALERALHPVERRHALPLARPADHETAARHLGEVEGV